MNNIPITNQQTAKSGQWCALDESTGKFNQPDYARFKLNLSYSHNANHKGYTSYYSLDYNNKTGEYNEMEGLRGLVTRMILEKPATDIRWAGLFVNCTLDLSTRSKNYDHLIAYWVGHRNTMPKFRPAWMTLDGKLKLDITQTLIAIRELNEIIAINKIYNRK
jgi:hypothetical protein